MTSPDPFFFSLGVSSAQPPCLLDGFGGGKKKKKNPEYKFKWWCKVALRGPPPTSYGRLLVYISLKVLC